MAFFLVSPVSDNETRQLTPPLSTQSDLPEVRGLLDDDFAVRLEEMTGGDGDLYPCERQQISAAVQKRRLEFASGRRAARRVLSQLGISPCAIPVGPDGSPIWPGGIKGSISHAGRFCLVAATRSGDVRGVGVDIEIDPAAALEVQALICTPAERAFAHALDDESRPLAASLFFSAKESFYKCQRPITGLFIDFQDVEIEVDLAARSFRLLRVPSGLTQRELLMKTVGRFDFTTSAVVTSAVIRQ